MADLDPREDPYNVTQASRIYFLPNAMTAGNLFCGFVSVIRSIQAHVAMASSDVITADANRNFTEAVAFIFGAAAFDMLDGRLARLGGQESLFGAEFDSLADVVSFGIAPALMVFFLILSPTQGYPVFRNIGWFFGFVYLLCAAIRLARFNVITNPLLRRPVKDSNKDFVGLPVPAAAATVGSLVLSLLQFSETNKELHRGALALPPLLLLIAILMVSTVRYPSGKNLGLQTRVQLRRFLVFFVGVGLLVVLLQQDALLILTLGYIFFGLIRHWRRSAVARRSLAA